jgi:hypothetical protein
MSVEERISELFERAKDEGITINPYSLDDLRSILDRPLIFLLDNGNFRIRWNFKNVHVAIEIQGDWKAEVLAFKQESVS